MDNLSNPSKSETNKSRPTTKPCLKQFTSRLRCLVTGIVIGVVVGVSAFSFLQNYNPPDDRLAQATAVFNRIVSQNEMVSVSQRYCIVDKVENQNEVFGIKIPLTDNSFWYRYAGTLKAGVNLQDAEFSQRNSSTIVITLSQPYIISNTPDEEISGVLEERNNVLNPIHVQDVDAFLAKCIQRSEDEAATNGLFDEAKHETENNLKEMFYAAFGNAYSVEIEWRE